MNFTISRKPSKLTIHSVAVKVDGLTIEIDYALDGTKEIIFGVTIDGNFHSVKDDGYVEEFIIAKVKPSFEGSDDEWENFCGKITKLCANIHNYNS